MPVGGGTATDWLDQRGEEGGVGVAADLGDEDAGEGAPGEVASGRGRGGGRR
jgi:hypothetical protein